MSSNGEPPRPTFLITIEAHFDDLAAASEFADAMIDKIDEDDFIVLGVTETGVSWRIERLPEQA